MSTGIVRLLLMNCIDRKSTRLNSSHLVISYAVFFLKKIRTRRLVFVKTPALVEVLEAPEHHSSATAVVAAHVRPTEVPAYLAALSFFFNDTATTEIYTLSLHDALPI